MSNCSGQRCISRPFAACSVFSVRMRATSVHTSSIVDGGWQQHEARRQAASPRRALGDAHDLLVVVDRVEARVAEARKTSSAGSAISSAGSSSRFPLERQNACASICQRPREYSAFVFTTRTSA
jgi:hypothetical protein